MPDPNIIIMPNVGTISVQLDLVQTAFHSLMLITRADHLSGLNNWVYETANTLTAEQLKRHHLVLLGLHYAVIPTQKWDDFPSYLSNLENSVPASLRDKVINTYLTIKTCDQHGVEFPDVDPETLLNDLDFFLEFLQSRFGTKYVDIDTETQAHALLNDPPTMKALKRSTNYESIDCRSFTLYVGAAPKNGVCAHYTYAARCGARIRGYRF